MLATHLSQGAVMAQMHEKHVACNFLLWALRTTMTFESPRQVAEMASTHAGLA